MTKAMRIPPWWTCGVTRRMRLPCRRWTCASKGAASVIESAMVGSRRDGDEEERKGTGAWWRAGRAWRLLQRVVLAGARLLSMRRARRERARELRLRPDRTTGRPARLPRLDLAQLYPPERARHSSREHTTDMAAPPSSPNAVLEALAHALSPDSALRNAAGVQLAAWATLPGYYAHLVQAVEARTHVPPDIRQQAAIQLKNGVDRYWRRGAVQCVPLLSLLPARGSCSPATTCAAAAQVLADCGGRELTLLLLDLHRLTAPSRPPRRTRSALGSSLSSTNPTEWCVQALPIARETSC